MIPPTRPLATQAGRVLKSFEKEVWRKNFFKSFSLHILFLFKKVFLKKHFRRKCANFFEFFRNLRPPLSMERRTKAKSFHPFA